MRNEKAPCTSCGQLFSVLETICPECKKEECHLGAVFCQFCGRRFNDEVDHVFTHRGFDWCEADMRNRK